MTAVISKQEFLSLQESKINAKIKPTVDLIVELFNDAIVNDRYVIKEAPQNVKHKVLIFESIVPSNVAVSFARELDRICISSDSQIFSTILKERFTQAGWGGIDVASLSLTRIQPDSKNSEQTQFVLQAYVYC